MRCLENSTFSALDNSWVVLVAARGCTITTTSYEEEACANRCCNKCRTCLLIRLRATALPLTFLDTITVLRDLGKTVGNIIRRINAWCALCPCVNTALMSVVFRNRCKDGNIYVRPKFWLYRELVFAATLFFHLECSYGLENRAVWLGVFELVDGFV